MICLTDHVKAKQPEVRKLVERRLKEFQKAGRQPPKEIFKELCFCLLTANFNAERSIVMQERIGSGFLTLPEHDLAAKLKELGHRYPNARASYIVEARKQLEPLGRALSTLKEQELRDWLVKNVKGLGYKEASHFLRNIGFRNLAIVDFHIVDLLTRHKLCGGRKSLNKARYLEIEQTLRNLGKELGMDMAELDLYLWYCETGKVLK